MRNAIQSGLVTLGLAPIFTLILELLSLLVFDILSIIIEFFH